MGWTLRGVGFTRNGSATNTDADGNNVAWVCDAPGCGSPVLLIYQRGRRGSAPTTPAICRKCGARYSLAPAYGSRQEPKAGTMQPPAAQMDIV